jgi:PPOX class probable F420-dependent enzyme
MIADTFKKLAQEDNFGTITTLGRDGTPMTHVMWVDCDDDHVLINTETGRAKYRNVKRDPRVSVTVWDKADHYTYAEVRGVVVDTILGPEAREHIDKLSVKYTGQPYDGSAIQTERVILKIKPERQRG